MNNLRITAAALALAASSSAAASADTVAYSTLRPITIVNYSIAPGHIVTVPYFEGGALDLSDTGAITISFVDERPETVSSVRFVVRSNDRSETIVDKGTFSQGATITHNFSLETGIDRSPDVSIDRVTFANGTVWQP